MVTKIEEAKVLIVGAGGIGCELLKTAVLSNFLNIHLVDLDTIELSNLNRQFLFRRRHIGQSKAVIAREAALKMNPSAHITAHFADITDTKLFPISFFKGFDIVMNALDNLAARRYVNSMCLMAKVPLIESGTAGYLGQTSIILNRKTECFDCIPKEAPKTFPVCTIRSTPSSPIHCIIWAKEFLFPNLFGMVENEANFDEENEALKDTWSSEQAAFESLKTLKNNPEEYYRKLAKKLFIEDIEKIKGIDELWKDRRRPVSLDEAELMSAKMIETCELNDHEIWSTETLIDTFKSALFKLLSRSDFINFDKDDADTLDLVVSAANLRAKVFGIDMKSKFEIKAMAGNIIPAIATTNAIAAAMIVIHAKNVLLAEENSGDNMCNAYINYGTNRNVFSIEKPCKPNPDCSVCSCDRGLIKLDTESVSIRDVLNRVVPLYLEELRSKYPHHSIEDFDEEDITVLEGSRLLYDIDDDNGNSQKTLSSLGVIDSKFLKLDFSPRRSLLLGIIHGTNENSDFTVEFDVIEPKTLKRKLEESDPSSSDDDELICLPEKDDAIEIIEKSVKKAKVGA